MSIRILLNSVRLIDTDPEGASLVVVGEREQLVFTGAAPEAADYLRNSVPVGQSVTVRHSRGLRSCMNKPSLWEDVAALA